MLRENYKGSAFIRCNYASSDGYFAPGDSPGIWTVGADTCACIEFNYATGVTYVLAGNMVGSLHVNTLYGTANPPPQQDLSPYETTADVDAKLANYDTTADVNNKLIGYETINDANARFIQGVQMGAVGSMNSPDNDVTTQYAAPPIVF